MGPRVQRVQPFGLKCGPWFLLFECGSSTGSVCGRVPTRPFDRLRASDGGLPVGGKGLPPNTRHASPRANGEAIRAGDAS